MLTKLLLGLVSVDSLLLLAAILLQAGKGGGLASTFGGVSSSADTIFGSRQAGNLLTKASWWCGGLFHGLSIFLSRSSAPPPPPKTCARHTLSPTTHPPPLNPAH